MRENGKLTSMNQLINNISDQEYDGLEGINFSKLKHLLDSPYHFKKNLENNQYEENTSLKVGLAVHCLSLTPHLFGDKFTVAPICDRRTKEGKIIWQEFINNNEGKTVLSQEEFDLVANCYKAIEANPYFKWAKDGEEVFFEAGGSTEIFGSKIKGRVDMFNKSKNVILDIKTCSEIPNIDNIRKAIYKHKYHMQAYFYKCIVDNCFNTNAEFVFLFIDKKHYNSIGLAKVGKEFFNRAAEQLNEALCRYENCKHHDVWPSLINSETPMIVDANQTYFADGLDIDLEDSDDV